MRNNLAAIQNLVFPAPAPVAYPPVAHPVHEQAPEPHVWYPAMVQPAPALPQQAEVNNNLIN